MKNANRNSRWTGIVISLILMVLIVDVVLTVKLSSDVKSTIVEIRSQKSLPCAAIPTKYILQEPECADKLLRVMNVTNVRILPRGSDVLSPEDRLRIRNLTEQFKASR